MNFNHYGGPLSTGKHIYNEGAGTVQAQRSFWGPNVTSTDFYGPVAWDSIVLNTDPTGGSGSTLSFSEPLSWMVATVDTDQPRRDPSSSQLKKRVEQISFEIDSAPEVRAAQLGELFLYTTLLDLRGEQHDVDRREVYQRLFEESTTIHAVDTRAGREVAEAACLHLLRDAMYKADYDRADRIALDCREWVSSNDGLVELHLNRIWLAQRVEDTETAKSELREIRKRRTATEMEVLGIVTAEFDLVDSAENVQASSKNLTSEELPSGIRIGDPYPNPFRSGLTLPIVLDGLTDVSIDLFDITGRLQTTIVRQVFESGRHAIEFSAQGLASGTYAVRYVLTSAEGKQTVRTAMITLSK